MFHVNGYGSTDESSDDTKHVSEKDQRSKGKPGRKARSLFVTPGGLGIGDDTSVQVSKQPVLPSNNGRR